MDDPAIEVRPIRAMLGPHHLNEVFFDGLRVTEADVLGTVDDGWSVVQEVLAFERVGIARYARCERLLQAAPTVLGDRWDDLPQTARPLGEDADALPAGPPARLPRGGAPEHRPGPARRRGGVPDRGHQAGPGQRRGVDGHSRRGGTRRPDDAMVPREVEDHWKYSQASTVASGSIEMQRILLSRTLLAAAK